MIFPAILYPFFSAKLFPNFEPKTPATPEKNKHKLTIQMLWPLLLLKALYM